MDQQSGTHDCQYAVGQICYTKKEKGRRGQIRSPSTAERVVDITVSSGQLYQTQGWG